MEIALEKYIGKENLAKVQQVKIGIAGAGGLGSNCAFNLVRSGFKNFIIVDFDTIEYSNLNRQFYFYDQVGRSKVEVLKENLLRINPDLNISVLCEKVTGDNVAQLFQDCDVVVEAFDLVEYKKLLIETYAGSGKFLVAASGMAGWGESDKITVKKVTPNFYLVGDDVSAVCETCPPISPRVNITAAKQADVILDWVLKENNGK